MGATYRIDTQASVYLGIGYDWGTVGSAGANADVGTVLGTIGARYAFGSLEEGPYVAARADLGGVDYQDRRPMGGGLGTATRHDVWRDLWRAGGAGRRDPLAPFTVTPQAGIRVAHVTLGGFNESGSELALDVGRVSHTASSLLAGVDVGWLRSLWANGPSRRPPRSASNSRWAARRWPAAVACTVSRSTSMPPMTAATCSRVVWASLRSTALSGLRPD